MANKSRRQIRREIRGRIAELEAEIRRLRDELDKLSRAPDLDNPSLSKEDLSKENLKKETRARGHEIPAGWERAAAEERERAGLCELDLLAEWRKMVIYWADKGRGLPTLGAWLLWALRAWLDQTNQPAPKPELGRVGEPAEIESGDSMPAGGSDRERQRAASYARTGKWAPTPTQAAEWGPAPGARGCTLPAALAAWAARNADITGIAGSGFPRGENRLKAHHPH